MKSFKQWKFEENTEKLETVAQVEDWQMDWIRNVIGNYGWDQVVKRLIPLVQPNHEDPPNLEKPFDMPQPGGNVGAGNPNRLN